jgi:hypothetical protein
MRIPRIGAALAVGLVTAGVVSLAPAPAQAGFNDCLNESGRLCFWPAANYEGQPGWVLDSNANWANFTDSANRCGASVGWNDCISSIRNEGLRCEAVIWEHPNMGGSNFVINRETFVDNLANRGKPSGGTWNDVVSSNSWFC